MNKAIFLVLFSVCIGCIGQMCIKGAMVKLGPVGFGNMAEIIDSTWRILQQPLIAVAIPLYAIGLIFWAGALSRLQLSFAYPLLAVGYFINPLLAMGLFNEHIPPLRWVGIAIIAGGLVLVGRS